MHPRSDSSPPRPRAAATGLVLALVGLVGLLTWMWRGAGRDPTNSEARAERALGEPPTEPAARSARDLAPARRVSESQLEGAGASTAEACVVVVRGEGRPLADARVRLLEDAQNGKSALAATTDETGRCTLTSGYRPVLELEVTAPGFLGRREELVWSERIELELLPCVALEGRVLDEETRQPIAGAHLHVRRRWSWTPVGDETRSGADGSFRLECAPDIEDGWLMAQADGYPEWRTAVPQAARARNAIEVELGRGPVLELEIVAFPSGRPVANARVGDACTDTEGRVNIGARTSDKALRLLVTAEGFSGIQATLPPEPARERTPLLLRLPKLARFAGVVRDHAGLPVSGATLEFRQTSHGDEGRTPALPSLPEDWEYTFEIEGRARSDAHGRYVSSPLLPGAASFRVRAVHPEAGDVLVQAGPLGAAGTLTRFDVVLLPRPLGALEGTVRFNGNWVPGSVSWRSGEREGSCKLDLDSRYRFDEVDAGSVELVLRSTWLDPVQTFLPETRANVLVEAGRTARHDFELVVPYAEIGGHLRDASGAPLEGLELTLRRRDQAYEARDKSGSDGRWRESVPDLGGEYEVELTYANELFRVDGVRPGNLRVDFVLPHKVTLPVRVLDGASGQPIERWQVAWRRRGEAQFRRGLSGGHARRPEQTFPLELVPGEYELLAQASEFGYRSRRIEGVSLEAGRAPATLEIRLENGLELELVLADGCGPPESEFVRLLLLEEEAWPSVRVKELDGGALYPGGTIHARRIAFEDERRAILRGLAPGRWRFKASPEDVVVEPEWVTLPHAGPLELRWSRR